MVPSRDSIRVSTEGAVSTTVRIGVKVLTISRTALVAVILSNNAILNTTEGNASAVEGLRYLNEVVGP